MPQGSVLGPTLFSLFCNDLPNTVEDCDDEIHIYADDTTIYVAVSFPDMIAVVLNVILQKLYEWCCLNRLIPHPLGCMGSPRQIAVWWPGRDTCTCRKDHIWPGWYTPSDQVLAQSKWPTVQDLYENRLLMLAHDCFHNFLPVPVMKLFTKYECNSKLVNK